MSVFEKTVDPEHRLKELGISLPQSPKPLGAYVESVQTGSLLFLSGNGTDLSRSDICVCG